MRELAWYSLLLLSAAQALAQTPIVNSGGVVDAATFTAPVAPGSLVSIFGINLAAGTAGATTVPLPDTLGHVSVSFNGIAAPLLYVSLTQINAQLPWEVPTTGAVSVVVTNSGASSAPQAVQVAASAPGLFSLQGRAIAVNPDGTLAAPVGSIPGFTSHPATPGDTLVLLASGLGPVAPAGITGDNSIDTLRRTTTTPSVLIGGASTPVSFSGLSPQFVGVYQVNFVMPSTEAPAAGVALQIQTGGMTSAAMTSIAIGAGWPQWAQNSQHANSSGVAGENLDGILANIVYDTLAPAEQAATGDELLAHYQVPLVDGNDVYMEYKSGTYSGSFATEIWGENRLSWQSGQLVQQWGYASDWKPPGSISDFWEPVFHAALANDAVYVPGASGSIVELNKTDGSVIRRVAPFGADPDTYETGPITVDASGNLIYNVIQITIDPANGFYANDVTNSWVVRVTPDGFATMASYQTLTSPEAPGLGDQCVTHFTSAPPWPPSTAAVPPTATCGSQRPGINISPAVAPDGTIYTVSRAQFNDRYAFLIALNPDLSKKWSVSLRNRLHDGCGVSVADGGWLPPNGTPGGCAAGALLGVDPLTNQPGDGSVLDSASSTPVVAPDGTILFGAWNRYNYAQGHLLHFDANGNYLGAFGFGWDTTPAIYVHDGTWSLVTKNNHYEGLGSYCDDETVCPPDRTSNNPASPEQYLVTQVDANMSVEWSYLNTNTESCTRNPDGSLTCVSDHPAGFEWCVNSPVVDVNGVVYANSEDGNLYAIGQGGTLLEKIFQQLALGAAYTPASLGGDGKIYSQNDGHLFVVGK